MNDKWEEALKAARVAQAKLDECFAGTDREASIVLKVRQLNWDELEAKVKAR